MAETTQVFLTGLNVAILAGLAVITWKYARSTRKIAEATRQQAQASKEMAEEIRDARFAAFRPIVAIRLAGSSTTVVPALFKNIGAGPALNLRCYLTHPRCRFTFKHDMYTILGVGEEQGIAFPPESFDGKEWLGLEINCDYEDVYGQPFRSTLEFSTRDEMSLTVFELNKGKPLFG